MVSENTLKAPKIIKKYVDNILNNKIPACKWVKLACQRYKNDLKRGLKFNKNKALEVIDFIQYLRHSKGEWAGRLFILEPWELFIIWNLFGWEGKDGFRRFRTAYLEMPRKNGKSTFVSAIGLNLAFADSEPGAEVYTAATKRDQALITHSEATRMVRSSNGLKNYISVFKNNLSNILTASKFEPLSSDTDTLDGLNIHGALVDELHAHKTRDLWDILDTATAARRQPLQIAITTAGSDKQSICWEQHAYTERILENVLSDDTFFGIIYTIDKEDDWEKEKSWRKANPNLYISVKVDDLKRKHQRARELPSQLNSFLRRHLNIWTESIERWIPDELWRGCAKPFDEKELAGRECYAGLDLSSSIDITALIYVFPPTEDKEPYKIICKFFIPQDNMVDRVKRDRVPYDVWVREGHIIATPGNVVDYAFVLNTIEQDITKYYIKELAFDRWGASKIMQDLQNIGFEPEDVKHYKEKSLVRFGQGYASMASPTKALEKMIRAKELSHNNNPVLRWMASNVVVKLDPAGNMKPDKSQSTEKIDGIVGLLMALDRALRHIEEEVSISVI